MFKKRHPQAGARPGTLVIPHDALPTRVHLVKYAEDYVCEKDIDDVSNLDWQLDDQSVAWIDVQGMADEKTLHALADAFDIHPLAIEGVTNVPQRPKAELYGYQQLIICRVMCMPTKNSIRTEQLSIILGPNYVVTFRELHSDLLEPVRQRIHLSDSRLRHSGSDYLAYALLDVIVDAYYPVIEVLGEKLERLEELVIERPDPKLLKELNSIRVRLANLRRAVSPKRELVRSLIHDDNTLIGENVRLFFRDTHDHVAQISDAVDMCRDMVTGLMNTYISAVGHRTNEVMKVLTIMSSIFVPLTFLAGIYGMNFEHMPELAWKWSYPFVWLAMLGCASGMLFFFRGKGWLGGGSAEPVFEQFEDERLSRSSYGPDQTRSVTVYSGRAAERSGTAPRPVAPSTVPIKRAS